MILRSIPLRRHAEVSKAALAARNVSLRSRKEHPRPMPRTLRRCTIPSITQTPPRAPASIQHSVHLHLHQRSHAQLVRLAAAESYFSRHKRPQHPFTRPIPNILDFAPFRHDTPHPLPSYLVTSKTHSAFETSPRLLQHHETTSRELPLSRNATTVALCWR